MLELVVGGEDDGKPPEESGLALPSILPIEVRRLTSSPMQVSAYEKNRGVVTSRIIQGLESVGATSGILAELGKLKAASEAPLYRPITGALQANKTGMLFRGVYSRINHMKREGFSPCFA